MERYTITYNGGLRTTSVHERSQTQLITDAPVDNHGKGESFSPTDLVANGLGACIVTIMGITAQTHNIDITGCSATVEKHMASNPRRIDKIVVTIQMPDRSYTQKEMERLQEAAHDCPVANSLSSNVEEEIRFHF